MQTTKAVASLQAEVAQLRHELQTIKGSATGAAVADDSLFVGQYLVERLVQLGVTVRTPLFPPARLDREANRGVWNDRKCLVFPETSTWVSVGSRFEIAPVRRLDRCGRIANHASLRSRLPRASPSRPMRALPRGSRIA